MSTGCHSRLRCSGRLGNAYSLLTREELPYLLDLHLFLSRPLAPAPLQSLPAAAEAADSLPADSSVYGAFPQVHATMFAVWCGGKFIFGITRVLLAHLANS
jgi:hypothetical protein